MLKIPLKRPTATSPELLPSTSRGSGQAMPVYIEGRNGNSPEKYPQGETPERAFPGRQRDQHRQVLGIMIKIGFGAMSYA
jgi:hypothetical protein